MVEKYTLTSFKVTNRDRVPKEHHYQIIVFKTNSVYHEGDERSRTNPGHGYPAHTEYIDNNELYVFKHQEEWNNALSIFYADNPLRTDILAQIVEKVATAKLTVSIS